MKQHRHTGLPSVSAFLAMIITTLGLLLALTPKPAYAMTASEYFSKSDAFLADSRWKNGIIWNGSQGPKLSTWPSTGCFAYACDFTMYMYGVNRYETGQKYYSVNDIRTGDVIRIYGHTFVVLERKGNDLRTAEGNYGGTTRKVRVADPGYRIVNGGLVRVDGGSTTSVTFQSGWHFDTGGATTRIVHQVNWVRLSGTYRYDTMKAIVSRGWPNVTGGTVVVATGQNYKDALSAVGLAGLDNAPVVLTSGSSLSQQARDVLTTLKPKKVYVAGGTSAVSDSVLETIQAVTNVVPERVSSVTAAGTSAQLAMAGKGRWKDGTAIITTNMSFKDALSVAPLSYAKGWPILLADNGNHLCNEVMQALSECGITQVVIVGGEQAVTADVVNKLADAGIGVLTRLSGVNGVATSRAIADWGIQNGLSANNMAYATSQDFPDALAGAALCGKYQSVLLLADDKRSGDDVNIAFSQAYASRIKTGYVLGGTAAVSDSLVDRLP